MDANIVSPRSFDEAGRVMIVPDFVDEAQRGRLQEWALAISPLMAGNGPGRRFVETSRFPLIPPDYAHLRQRVEQYMGLGRDAEREPIVGWYVSIVTEGGAVHAHRDKAPSGKRHLRCNLFVQSSEGGGRPVIDDLAIGFTERSLLAFFANEQLHWSEPTVGPRPRIIMSFGYLVPDSYHFPRPDPAG